MRSKQGWRRKTAEKRTRDNAIDERGGYKEIEKTNTVFETYYKVNI
jgi:hypothetical protein